MPTPGAAATAPASSPVFPPPLHFAECFFIVAQSRKAVPHLEQECGVLPVWSVRCSLKREDDENTAKQSRHLATKFKVQEQVSDIVTIRF